MISAGASSFRRQLGLILLLIASGCAQPQLPTSHLTEGGAAAEMAGTSSYSPELLRQTAAALASRGLYDRRPVHGLAMRNSLRLFQEGQGLAVTGRIDAETLAALGLDAGLLAPEEKAREPHAGLRADLADRIQLVTGARRAEATATGLAFLAGQAASVAALVNEQGIFCSGFLVGPEILLTSSSCLATREQCEQTVARFTDLNGARLRAPDGDYRCLEIIETGELLDYAAIRLEEKPGLDWGYLTLSERPPSREEPLMVTGFSAGKEGATYAGCRVEEEGDAAMSPSVLACATEIELPGAPVISRWSNLVFGLLPTGKVSPSGDGAGVAIGQLSAECRCCEPSGRENRVSGFSTLRGEGLPLSGRNGFSLSRDLSEKIKETRFTPAWLEKWNLHGKYRLLAADVDGNGRHDLVLHNSRWLAIFKWEKEALRLHWISHEQVGGWQLSGADQAWPGDFNGDGRTDLLLFAGHRPGVLLAEGGKLIHAWQGGSVLGTWQFGRGDRFYPGDFTGDGRHEILVRRGAEAAVFGWRHNRLEQLWTAVSRLDAWQLHGADEHYLGDFTGDGSDEVIVRRGRRLALWKMSGERPRVQWLSQGSWGSWVLGPRDQLLIADFNGDGRDDVLIRNDKAMALQVFEDGKFTTSWIRSSPIDGWILSPLDHVAIDDSRRKGGGTALLFSNPWAGGRFVFNGSALVKDYVTAEPASGAGAGDTLFR